MRVPPPPWAFSVRPSVKSLFSEKQHKHDHDGFTALYITVYELNWLQSETVLLFEEKNQHNEISSFTYKLSSLSLLDISEPSDRKKCLRTGASLYVYE